MYFRPETNTIFQTQSEIRSAFPDVSMPELLNDLIISWFGVFPVFQTRQPEYNHITQGIRELNPELIGDNWHQVWEVYALTPEEIAANEELMRQQNKSQAEALLQATDWTEGKSVRDITRIPHLVNGDEFDDYRVALRIIALNPPLTVTEWPIKPEEVWVNS